MSGNIICAWNCVNLDLWDKIKVLLLGNWLKPETETRAMKKYKRGIVKAEADLDILDIVNTLDKLKSGLSAIIGNNKEYLELAKQLYI